MEGKNEGKGFKGLSSLGSNVDSDKPTTRSSKSSGRSSSSSGSATQGSPTSDSAKGFGGLSALSSTEPNTQKEKSTTSESKKPPSGKVDNNKPSCEIPNSEPRRVTKPQTEIFPPKENSTGKYWFFGILGFFIFIIFIGQESDNRSSPSTQRTSQPSTTSTTPPPRTPSTSSSEVTFSAPPVGSGRLLNVAQIRWCLREEIRINTRRSLTSTNVLINRFNQQVDFFNRRCANFEYYVADMNRARREVEARRTQIVAEARRDFASPPISSRSASGTSSTRTGATTAPTASRTSSSEFSSMGLTFKRPTTSGPSNRIFSIEEIRWCLREQIMLDVRRRNTRTNPELNQYNVQLNNYQNRCLQRWRQSGNDYQTAKNEIERIRMQLIDSAGGFLDRQTQLVYEIQWLLNRLGYESGQIDGVYGPITRRAIESFERDTRRPIMGRANTELRNNLRDALN